MTDPETKVPSDENPEGERPRQDYDIIPSKREEPEANFTAASRLYSAIARTPAEGRRVADEPLPAQAQPAETGTASHQPAKVGANQTRVYAIIGIASGLLVGCAIAALFIHSARQNAPVDMGAITTAQFGLKGHLNAKWGDNRLAYQVTIEPSAPEQRAAFIAAVSTSPRPLFIDIQLKDPFGTVLCGHTVLLKYDPRNAAPPAAAEPDPRSAKRVRRLDNSSEIQNQINQTTSLAKLQLREIDREHGNDLFQNDLGTDGNIASISAQGILPCTKQQFDDAATWGFNSNFPVVAQPESTDSNGDQSGDQGSTGKNSGNLRASEAASGRRRSRPEVSPISIEGDDQIIWFDASTGVIATRAGKALVIDKTDSVANALKNRDFPVAIHYRCDETGACTFAGVGNVVERARLRR
ncbi:MAG TPA: hypothetical protein VMW15_03695 [Terracidiphilus sp.]|nr:hypothetical protein [Terracidiphilus sp.]